MPQFTNLPNEILLRIFQDLNRSRERPRYIREFWCLPYLHPQFLSLCVDENARSYGHTSKSPLQTYEEKLAFFRECEARYISGKFFEEVACREYKKPYGMLLTELTRASFEEEGIRRERSVLEEAARIMTTRRITRYPMYGPDRLCCRFKSESPFWHWRMQVRHFLWRQRMSWYWWFMNKKRDFMNWITGRPAQHRWD